MSKHRVTYSVADDTPATLQTLAAAIGLTYTVGGTRLGNGSALLDRLAETYDDPARAAALVALLTEPLTPGRVPTPPAPSKGDTDVKPE